MKILLILSKFHEKTLSRPGDIKMFLPGKIMYMYTFLPFMEVVLIFWVGSFSGEIFLEPNI